MKLAVLLFCAMVAMAAAYSVGPPKSPKPTMQEEPLDIMTAADNNGSPDSPRSKMENDDIDSMFQELSDETAAVAGVSYSSIPYATTKSLRSYIWSPAVRVSFYNYGREQLNIYWINYAGYCVLYNRLAPGRGYSQSTYTSHGWVATTTSGAVRGIYVPFGVNAAVILY